MSSLQWVSRAHRDLGEFEEADRRLRQFMELAEKTTPNADFVLYSSMLSRGHEQRGHLEAKRGDLTASVSAFAQAIELLEQSLNFASDEDPGLKRRIGSIRTARAEALLEDEQLIPADHDYEAAITILAPMDDSKSSEISALRAVAFAGRARIAFLQGNQVSAEAFAAQATLNAERYVALPRTDDRYGEAVAAATSALAATRAAVKGDLQFLRDELEKGVEQTDEQLADIADAIVLFTIRSQDRQASCDLCRGAMQKLDKRLAETGSDGTKPRVLTAKARLSKAMSTACQ